MTPADILIVGSGPAGSTAAIHARSAGLAVNLVDRAGFPRDKTCGDGLTTLALRELAGLGLRSSAISGWRSINSLEVTSPSGRVVQLDLPEDGATYVAIAPRHELDNHLLDRARESGATITQNATIDQVVHRDGIWVAHCDDGSLLEARYVLHGAGARGLRSLQDSSRGRRNGRGDEVLASRVYLEGTGRLPDRVHLWFWDQVAPGYAWLFPVGEDGANVGVVLHTKGRSPSDVVAATETLLESSWLGRLVSEAHLRRGTLRTWPIPTRMHRSPAASGVFRMGDAAGLADPMTGEGIAQAVVSARLAIESIRGDFERPGKAASTYERAIHRAFSPDQRTSRMLLWPLRRPRWAQAAVRFMGMSDDLSDWFARWTFEDVPRRAVLSPPTLLRSLGKPRGAVIDDGLGPPTSTPSRGGHQDVHLG